MPKFENLTGQKIGRLTIIKRADTINKRTYWECRCDCGTLKIVGASSLKWGKVSSCGCLKSEMVTKRKITHGCNKTRLYQTWKHMRQRCNNPRDKQFIDYGDRGIKICEEWDEFIKFRDWAIKNGYKDNLSIDRIDNNGNYEPNNCRWANDIQQANNKRNNHVVRYMGQEKTIAQWAEEYNLKKHTLWARIVRYKWPIEKALSPLK